ncbi:hypothetical protein K4K60_003385 [Colletotrichum sp. SAR11_57]|nr:hypothetical protein K4K60_003385 [Colletotrichum sp. SAR11_57]
MACAARAKKLTDFFDEDIILEEEDKKLLARVGKYAWEDSMEMDTALWWTHDFADSFRTQRGYDIATCLPFLIQRENYWAAQNLPYGESFLSQDNNNLISRCNDDYRLTLQHGYEKYTRATSEWAHERGLEYSNQPAYNLPLNMLDSIPLVNAPEGESLGFNDSPSLYRHLCGPAHMARNSVISSEAGAVNGASYTQTIQDLLRTVRRGLAGGVSMNVFHGYAYSGVYAQTTWPGYTVFSYTFTDMWGPRMPAWRSRHNGENGAGFMADAMAYVARNQFISQIGTARVDLAFYQYAAPFAKVVYDSDNLERLGFTYDYLGPASFSSSNAIVGEGGVLAPDGPAYKALIFADQTKLTPEMAAQTKAFAEAGLPIFVIGSTDFQSVGVDGAASVPEIMANALAMEALLYTDTQDANTTTATNNTRITTHLGPGTATVTLATGQTLAFTASQLPEATDLDAWNITVNDWRSDNDSFSMETAITPHQFPDIRLAPWKDMDPVNLGDTSGTADYETTFRTPFSSVADQRLGARLHLGAITDAVILWVNGDKVIFDVNSSPDVVVDMTKYLNPAGDDNVVKVEVASTLYNRVRAEQDSIMTFGVAASVPGASFFNANPAKVYGLKGPVLIQWVEVVDVL